jgi:photosystem II stability/assembly factor-like uncharacterized protein
MVKKILCLLVVTGLYPPCIQAANPWQAITPGGGGVFCNAAIDPDESNIIYLASDVAGLMRSDDRGITWTTACKGLGHKYVQGVAFDPDNINGLYVAAADGVYHSGDKGENWTRIGAIGRDSGEGITPGMPSDIRVVADGTDKVIYVGTGLWADDNKGTGEIWVSRDDGFNWNSYSIGMTDTNAAVYSIVSRDLQPGEVWVSTGDGVYRSGNYGATWSDKTAELPHRNARKMQCDPYHTYELAVVLQAEGTNSSGVFYRDDATKKWVDRTGNLPLADGNRDIEYTQLQTSHYAFPNTMIVASNNRDTYDGVYKTTNGGTTWNLISDPANIDFGWFLSDVRSWLLEYDSAGSGDILIGGDGRLLQSTDNGSTFADITTVMMWEESMSYGNITAYTNSAYNVNANRFCGTGETDNMVVRMVTVDPFDSNNIFLSCADHVLFRSDDNGASFQRINFKLSGQWVGGAFDVTFDPDIQNRVYALVSKGYGANQGEGAIMVSDNGGDSWDILAGTYDEIGDLPGEAGHQLIFGPADGSGNRKMFVSLYQGGVYESSDYGANWTLVGLPGLPVRQITVNPSNDNLLFAGISGGPSNGVWKLYHDGSSWSGTRKLADVDTLNVQALDYQTYFSGTTTGLYKTSDQGLNWSKVDLPGSSSTEKVWGIRCDGKKVYVSEYGDNANIFRSSNKGVSWTEITRELDNPQAMWITTATHSGKRWLYAATQGNGVWRVQLKNWE